MVLFAGAAIFGCAEADGAVNPRREEAEESLQWIRRQMEMEEDGFHSRGESVNTLQLILNEEPGIGKTGRFTLKVLNPDGSEFEYTLGIVDKDRDPQGYVYFSGRKEENKMTVPELYSAGNYRVWAFLYKKGVSEIISGVYYDFSADGDETLETKAQEIVDLCRAGSNDWQTALNLHDWLTENAYYDPDYEFYGADLIFRGKGVCDAYSKAYQLLCETAGISVKRVISADLNHSWNAISIGGVWYQVDVTWDDPAGEEIPKSGSEQHQYFCLDDEILALDHSTDDWTFTGCSSMDLNYHLKTGTWKQFGMTTDGKDQTEEIRAEIEAGTTLIHRDRWTDYMINDTQYSPLDKICFSIYIAGLKADNDWEFHGTSLKVRIKYTTGGDSFDAAVTGWYLNETGEILLPDGLETVQAESFAGVNATTVRMPSTCKTIESEAFSGSGVRTVYASDGIESLAEDAFLDCSTIIFILDGQNPVVEAFAVENEDLVLYREDIED